MPSSVPCVVVVSDRHSELLLDQFSRYARDYDVVAVSSAAEALEEANGSRARGNMLRCSLLTSTYPTHLRSMRCGRCGRRCRRRGGLSQRTVRTSCRSVRR